MFYYYTPSVRRKIRSLALPVFLVLCGSFTSFSQEIDSEINSLLAQREVLLQSSESTLEVDKQLFNLGYRPKAQVTIVGNQVTFPLFLPVSPNKQAVMEARIKSIHPTLTSLVLIEETQTIRATFSSEPTTQHILDVITHFGFNSYEAH